MLLRRLIGEVLRRTRLAQGRTLREVAAAARVSMAYLSELEARPQGGLVRIAGRDLPRAAPDARGPARPGTRGTASARAAAGPGGTAVADGAHPHNCSDGDPGAGAAGPASAPNPARDPADADQPACSAHDGLADMLDDVVDEPVLQGLLSGEPAVPVAVPLDRFDALTRVGGDPRD